VACITGMAMAEVLQGCAGARYVSSNIEGDDLVVPLSQFLHGKTKELTYKKYVIIQQDLLKFPICIYRFSSTQYKALWLECTHQGAELQVFGDKIQCPAHGSEFNHEGLVQNGPADKPLRSFPIVIEQDHLRISLKKEATIPS